jgi:hypothetical protein
VRLAIRRGGSGEIYYRRRIANNIDSTLVRRYRWGGQLTGYLKLKSGWPHRIRRGRGTGPAKRSTIIGKNIGLAAYRLRTVGVLAAVWTDLE